MNKEFFGGLGNGKGGLETLIRGYDRRRNVKFWIGR